MTGALNTLAAGPGHGDDITRDDSIASRLVRLRDLTRKPWVVVVDGGRFYDAMAARIEDGGIPVFRAADRALAVFNAYAAEMLRRRAAREARPSASRRPARAPLEVRETVPGATP
jgi:hypothetical protein